MRHHISAHTIGYLEGGHVDYVSINVENDGNISICVREADKQSTVFMTRGEFMQFLERAVSAMTTAA